MQIAILGDIHSNYINLEKALARLKNRDICHIIVVGDLQNPEIIDIIASTNIKVSIVFGNADYDREAFYTRAKNFKNVEILGDFGELELHGRKIWFDHYHLEAIDAAKTGKYDVVFSGHRHSPWEEKFGKTIYLRPGEIAASYFEPTFCIFDLETMKSELVFVNK